MFIIIIVCILHLFLFVVNILVHYNKCKQNFIVEYFYINKYENLLLFLSTTIVLCSFNLERIMFPALITLGYLLFLHYLAIKIYNFSKKNNNLFSLSLIVIVIVTVIPIILIEVHINYLEKNIKDMSFNNILINLFITLAGFIYYILIMEKYFKIFLGNKLTSIFKMTALVIYLCIFYLTIGITSIFFENDLHSSKFDITYNIINGDNYTDAIFFVAKGMQFTTKQIDINYKVKKSNNKDTNVSDKFKNNIYKEELLLKIISMIFSAVYCAILLDIIIKLFSNKDHKLISKE